MADSSPVMDYSPLKVADLKEKLKSRGIPLTGLRLKQQFIDKLLEADKNDSPASSAAEPEANSENSPKPDTTQLEDLAEQNRKDVEMSLVTTADGSVQSGPQPDTEMSEYPSLEHSVQDTPERVAENREQIANTLNPVTTKPVESIAPSATHLSEADTKFSTTVPTQEALEDHQKRKRRSQSPIPTAEAIAHKKFKAEEAIAPAVHTEGGESSKDHSQEHNVPGNQGQMAAAKSDARFRGLFASTESAPSSGVPYHGTSEPAKHAPTSTLYIEGLMRPMQPDLLRKHLISLAAAQMDVTPTPELLVQFFLDSIKTHCFVRFQGVEVAVGVRDVIHGAVWPDERNRKSLSVDFIPDDKMDEWINQENSTQSRAGPPVRYEVQYRVSDEGTSAFLAEIGSKSGPQGPARDTAFNRPPPTGPRGMSIRGMGTHQVRMPEKPEEGFKPLNELFKSTIAKPMLYYHPVPRSVADKRLDQFDELLSKGTFSRRGGDETRRITFEDDDFFVDNGPEYGAQARRNNISMRGRGRRGGHGGKRGGR
ncbi:hypothetical protein N7495_001082 [Penicillium taxi]|uniref:uncharacterized protein n=1 Tax=Penicillium taxi TaxID=168475 RepID=UPI00254533C6|nr:uncharacterized protein N7495_001082 [Penicillium taxi]KAJ5908400.1 hypothetical protein N7495_001082 [Penicillium taxi]